MASRTIKVHYTGDPTGIHPGKPTVDISEPLKQLCTLLDLEYRHVYRTEITPTEVSVVVYEPNEDGRKHVDEHGAVMRYRRFSVRT